MKDHIKVRPTPFYWALAICMTERCQQKKIFTIKQSFDKLEQFSEIGGRAYVNATLLKSCQR